MVELLFGIPLTLTLQMIMHMALPLTLHLDATYVFFWEFLFCLLKYWDIGSPEKKYGVFFSLYMFELLVTHLKPTQRCLRAMPFGTITVVRLSGSGGDVPGSKMLILKYLIGITPRYPWWFNQYVGGAPS